MPELAAACDALAQVPSVDVTVEDAATTLQKLDRYDGWLTLDPWAGVAGIEQPGSAGPPLKLASSDLAIAVVQERVTALQAVCGGTITWKCLGQHQGRSWVELGGDSSWGPLRAGLPAPQSALGLVLYADAVTSYFGRADFGTNDFDADFTVWQSNLKATFGGITFASFVAGLPTVATAVGTTSAAASTGLGTKADRVVLVGTGARAVVELVPLRTRDLAGVANDAGLRRALVVDGWTGDANASTGLPDAGVLFALLKG